MQNRTISKKRKAVADGVFRAELHDFLSRELAPDGFAGVEVRLNATRTELIVRATNTLSVLGERGRRIRELTSIIEKRFDFAPGTLEMYAEKVANRGLSAEAQAESLRYKLLGGMQVRRAAYGVVKYIMGSGARGCEVIITGKLRAARAKAQKYGDGYLIKQGKPSDLFLRRAVRHVMMRQGVLGVKVAIMLPQDPTGRDGPKKPIPDVITILPPPADKPLDQPANPTQRERGNRGQQQQQQGGF